jgi:hypothetical protein
MKTTALGLICALFLMAASDGLVAQEAAAWQRVAEAIPLGSKIKIQTANGNRMSGTLMGVTADGVMVKKSARRPEPAMTVAFSDMARLERDHGSNANIGKAIAVGIAAGAGVILGLFAIALQLD